MISVRTKEEEKKKVEMDEKEKMVEMDGDG